ncbi:hypothetical protein G9P44_001010 [Scheffersomyces stipitis]|nr:hypothetical protein G9P44_001010 [Scheffersomyces stipitis]
MSLPNPPVLKTTIIQLNKELDTDDSNYEILTNDYLNNARSGGSPGQDDLGLGIGAGASAPSKKKRRRSSANIDSEELAKRKHETKQLHSIIEKRRRIKINREFEALKYLIPACRSTTPGGGPPGSASSASSNSKKPSSSASNGNNNGNKIDGMYKLTILKSSVEYILYLHHIIQKQHSLLAGHSDFPEYNNFDIDFARIPLNVNQYRNIDKDFSFKDLLSELDESGDNSSNSVAGSSSSSTASTPAASSGYASSGLGAKKNFDFRNHIIEEEEDEDFEVEPSAGAYTTVAAGAEEATNAPTSAKSSISSKGQLPSPDITPDMAPILTMLNKYSNNSQSSVNSLTFEARKNSYPISPNTVVIHSANPSPYTQPLKSTLSTPVLAQKSSSTSPPFRFQRSSSSNSTNGNNKFSLPDPAVNPTSSLSELPRKKYFKSRIPINNAIFTSKSDDDLNDEDASKTLLALRKSSIDSLLN